jgi:hypothetical protein
LVTIGPAQKTGGGRHAKRPDDLSDYVHRQLIGYIGLSLPFVLYFLAGVRGAPGTERWDFLDSISAYYYTGAVAAFVGLLVALALFLFSYQGYRNTHHRWDRLIAGTAGFAALGVAFFPTTAPTDSVPPTWIAPTVWLHYASAVVLFGSFAAFCLWLFRLKAPNEHVTRDKSRRNRIYLLCGVAIIGGMAWTALNASQHRRIFWPESVCIVAFSISWLTKGRAVRSIRSRARALMKKSRGTSDAARPESNNNPA